MQVLLRAESEIEVILRCKNCFDSVDIQGKEAFKYQFPAVFKNFCGFINKT